MWWDLAIYTFKKFHRKEEKIMSEVIEITQLSKDRAKIKLDAQASYTVMKECLQTLEMNSMPELKALKAMMRRTMKDMVEIGKHGKKRSR